MSDVTKQIEAIMLHQRRADVERVTARLVGQMRSVADDIDQLPPELLTPALRNLRDNLRVAVASYEANGGNRQ